MDILQLMENKNLFPRKSPCSKNRGIFAFESSYLQS